MKTISQTYNGFHGHTTFRLRVPDNAQSGDIIPLSRQTVQRINRLICGVSDCRCNEGLPVEGSDNNIQYRLTEPGIEIMGRYHQQ